MSKNTAEYAIVPGEGINPGSQLVSVRLPDGRPLTWDRRTDFDAHIVELIHEHACRVKAAGYEVTPDPLPLWHKQRKREIPAELKARAAREEEKRKATEAAKPTSKAKDETKTTKDPED